MTDARLARWQAELAAQSADLEVMRRILIVPLEGLTLFNLLWGCGQGSDSSKEVDYLHRLPWLTP